MATMTLGHIAREHGKPSGYLIGALPDSALLMGSPLLALVITALAFASGDKFGVALSVLIAAHLAVTFVRTHGNPGIFAQHRLRFTLIPAALFVILATSPMARGLAIVVAVIWDVHHSGMQTFGLARLYSRKAGNHDVVSRRLDLLLNHVLYAGPILAGAGLLLHLERTGPLAREWGVLNLTLDGPGMHAARVVLVAAGLFAIAAHVIGHWRLARRGVPISPQAITLLAATALTSIISWGFDPFGMALFTMKLFHCVQYFTLMAVAERSQVSAWFGDAGPKLSLPRVALALLIPALAYGAFMQSPLGDESGALTPALILSVTLLHFWYDGFTWTARSAPEASP